MIRESVQALAACVVTFVVCAVAYPAAVWGLAQLAFPRKAEGSLIYDRERNVIGSELIAQPFASDRYFQPRPSAADYKADAASGSNLGTKNPDLRTKVKERAEALKATTDHPAPTDLISASGSGLDPDISTEAALFQAERVASARNLLPGRVRTLIARLSEHSGAIIGAPPRVNVLRLNLALEEEKPEAEPTPGEGAAPAVTGETPSQSSTSPPPSLPAHLDSTAEIAGLRSQIDNIAPQIKQLHEQLEQQKREVGKEHEGQPGVQSEWKSLEEQVARLVENDRTIPSLIERIDGIEARVKSAALTIQTLRAEVGEARGILKRVASNAARR
jgi:K+-transporting ATPase ATPase C chain